jgi:phospholipid/cholesterol/gamma-HCH transport system substrate-binding protein
VKPPTPGQQFSLGLSVTIALVAVILACLNLNKLPLLRSDNTLEVQFAEAGGLKAGDDVLVSGAKVGKVSDVHLDRDVVVAELTLSDRAPKLGGQTRASIITVTLLGRAGVELLPGGDGRLDAGDTIPVERTSSPYSLTSALNQLTGETAPLDKKALADALGQVSDTFRRTPDEVGPALDGIAALSTAVSENDANLRTLLSRADRVTGVLAGRNQQITALLTSGTSLLGELDARQEVVVGLLRNVRALSRELRALVDENDTTIGPALRQLNDVVDLLTSNKRNLQQSITGLRNYATAFGEALSSGPWFDAYIQNLTAPGTMAPVISGMTP